jgi:hypothetical protein
MKNMRRLLVTTAAVAGLMALTATSNAIGPGYGPDSPAREGASQSRDYREGTTSSAPGGEVDRGSGCMRKDSGSGTGTGGSMDTAGKGTGTGTGGTLDSGSIENRPGGR